MNRCVCFVAAVLVYAFALPAHACGDIQRTIAQSLSDDVALSSSAKELLRKTGPIALDLLFEMRDKISTDVTRSRVDEIIDFVSGQKYGSFSRLYWHTDLEAAKSASESTGKPILSLRMLGNLTDEFSCANSRFFRTLLYANKDE